MNAAARAGEKPLGRIVVISDVHVGGGELDDFTAELQEHLVRFLSELSVLTEPVELVINGDFFDFATAEPWDDAQLESQTADGMPLCFTEAQSCQKLEMIIRGHQAIFDALARFLVSGPRRQVTMLPGNHDADLFWPKVRQRVAECLAKSWPICDPAVPDGFRFLLERQYVIQRAGIRYWIEHGHQHDLPNSFFPGGQERWSAAAPPIFKDVKGQERLYECPGTMGLVRHINHWRTKYHSISYLKPYSRVLWALIKYRAFKEPGRPLMVLKHLGAMLGWQVDWKTALSSENDLQRTMHMLLQQLAGNLSAEEERQLVDYLGERGIHVKSSLQSYASTESRRNRIFEGIASDQRYAGNDRSIDTGRHTLNFIGGGLIDVENRALLNAAKRLLDSDMADYVLTGHTHVPATKLNGRYLNGGCWIANQEVNTLSDANMIIFERGPVAYKLTYIEIGASGVPECKVFGSGHIDV